MTRLKCILGIGLLTLLAYGSASAQEADPETLIRMIQENQVRLQRLDRIVADLQSRLGDLEDQLANDGTGRTEQPSDPLIGSWQCTNNVFNNRISFAKTGKVVQQEATFGNARNATWSRLNEREIAVAGNVVIQTDFDSADNLTLTIMRNNATWQCDRR